MNSNISTISLLLLLTLLFTRQQRATAAAVVAALDDDVNNIAVIDDEVGEKSNHHLRGGQKGFNRNAMQVNSVHGVHRSLSSSSSLQLTDEEQHGNTTNALPVVTRSLGSVSCNNAAGYDNYLGEYYIIYNTTSDGDWQYLEHGGNDDAQDVEWETMKNTELRSKNAKYIWNFRQQSTGGNTHEVLRIEDNGDSTPQFLGRRDCPADSRLRMNRNFGNGNGVIVGFHYTYCGSGAGTPIQKGDYWFRKYARGKLMLECHRSEDPTTSTNRPIIKDGGKIRTHPTSTNWQDGTEFMVVKREDVTKW